MIRTKHLSHLYSPGTPFETAAIEDVNIHIEKALSDYYYVIEEFKKNF